jgi:hypothetical protein
MLIDIALMEALYEWGIEALEHMSEQEGKQVIANICRSTGDVLFSSTTRDFYDPTHVNVRPRSYWIEKVVEHGFYLYVHFDANFSAPHAVRFLKGKPAIPPLIFMFQIRDHYP